MLDSILARTTLLMHAIVLAGLLALVVEAPAGLQEMMPPPTEDAAAEAEKPAPTEGLSTPRDAVATFITAAADGDTTTAASAFPASSLPATEAVRARTMSTFATVLTRLGWSEANQRLALSNDPGSSGDAYTIYPWTGPLTAPPSVRSRRLADELGGDWRIVLDRGEDGAWRFTPEAIASERLDAAIAAINRQRRQAGDPDHEATSINEWFALNAPSWMLDDFLSLAIWQWLGLASIVLAGLVVDLLVRLLVLGFVRKVLRGVRAEVDDRSVRRAVRGVGLVATTFVWLVALELLGLPLAAFAILQPAARFALVLAIFWLGWRATDLLAEVVGAHAASTDTKLDDILVPMVRKTIKVLLVVFAMLNLAPMLGLNLGPLLAAIGVGSFGFAFAFKNSLENLFGSVTVILDRPFQVGDWIVIDGVEGTVETVGLRSTRIRTFYNSLVTMPNAALITTKVDNYGLRKYRRWSTKVGILYGTPVARIDAFCEAIREIVREHPYTRKDYYQVWLNGFGDSALEILVYVFWEAPDWQTELRERHRLMLDMMRVADELGVDFAFPSRTVYLQRGTPPTTPSDPSLDEADPRTAMRSGRVAVREVVEGADWKDETPPKYRFLSAEETARIDDIPDAERATAVEKRLEQRERTDLPAESGADPENPDFTEQREAGG